MPNKRPLCPVCNNPMSRTIVGMPVFPLPEGYVSVGCLMEEGTPKWLCEPCSDKAME